MAPYDGGSSRAASTFVGKALKNLAKLAMADLILVTLIPTPSPAHVTTSQFLSRAPLPVQVAGG